MSFDSDELNKSMTSQEFNEVNQEINEEIDSCVEEIKHERGGNLSHKNILDLMMESVKSEVRRHTQ